VAAAASSASELDVCDLELHAEEAESETRMLYVKPSVATKQLGIDRRTLKK
tara:strand:- start:5698 stop:5850 length:153 start_codon:yes stop_codon:yes gene_type:complete